MKLAVVGTGIAGLGAAWRLRRAHDVTLYEAETRPGGVAHTVEVEGAAIGSALSRVAVDTGFIAYNEPSCPRLTALFVELGVETQPSEATFSVSLDGGRSEYRGRLGGLVARPGKLSGPRFLIMLRDMVRFYRSTPALIAEARESDLAIADLMSGLGYSRIFLDDHLLPLGAAIRMATPREVGAMHAETFLGCLDSRGLLGVKTGPHWRSVSGGSRTYVDLMTAPLVPRMRLGTRVVSVERDAGGVRVVDGAGGDCRFDGVVLAIRADQALAVLGDGATAEERALLGAFGYTTSSVCLHTDRRLMPRRRRAWSAWNYLGHPDDRDDRLPTLTCWMNRLQKIASSTPVLLSVNPAVEPAPEHVLGSFTFDQPQLDAPARRAQSRLAEIQGRRVWFCGAYCGYGSHEDALVSGLAVAAQIERAVEYGLLEPSAGAVA